jgi:DNA-binding GntR family transcriptional regulator
MLRFSFGLSVLSCATAIASLALHEAVLTAVIRGNGGAAREATRILIDSARLDIQRRIESGRPPLDAWEA